MNQLTSLFTIEVLLSIVYYIVIISFITMIGKISCIIFSTHRERPTINSGENDKSTIESN
jgi:hypothetical protein